MVYRAKKGIFSANAGKPEAHSFLWLPAENVHLHESNGRRIHKPLSYLGR